MEQDVEELAGRIDELEATVRALQSRLRLTEARLQNRGVSLSNDKGRTKTLRLSSDAESIEVK